MPVGNKHANRSYALVFYCTDEWAETERKREQGPIRATGCTAGCMRVYAAERRLETCYVNAFSKNTALNGQMLAVWSGLEHSEAA